MNRLKTLLLFSFIAFYSQLFACSCAGVDDISKEEYNSADAIFIGEVVKIEESQDNFEKVITFKVTTHLKSDTSQQEFKIWTAESGRSCGLEAKLGESWYIFSLKDDTSRLCAGMCGRSINLSKLNDPSNSKFHWYEKLKNRLEQDLNFIEQIKNHE
jgi:hypothetical protein